MKWKKKQADIFNLVSTLQFRCTVSCMRVVPMVPRCASTEFTLRINLSLVIREHERRDTSLPRTYTSNVSNIPCPEAYASAFLHCSYGYFIKSGTILHIERAFVSIFRGLETLSQPMPRYHPGSWTLHDYGAIREWVSPMSSWGDRIGQYVVDDVSPWPWHSVLQRVRASFMLHVEARLF